MAMIVGALLFQTEKALAAEKNVFFDNMEGTVNWTALGSKCTWAVGAANTPYPGTYSPTKVNGTLPAYLKAESSQSRMFYLRMMGDSATKYAFTRLYVEFYHFWEFYSADGGRIAIWNPGAGNISDIGSYPAIYNTASVASFTNAPPAFSGKAVIFPKISLFEV